MAVQFASAADLSEKTITFEEIGKGLYGFTAEGDPNSGVIVGEESCMVIDAQATPALAGKVIEAVRKVTDKPIAYVVLSHYHAVRVLGASAFKAREVIASDACRAMIVERGQEDWDSEFQRFPRLFRNAETIPGLTWPTLTFAGEMTLWLGKRAVYLKHIGRGHTAGDIVAWVPDEQVMFSGDLVEYKSACYCGDAHFRDWQGTLDRLVGFKPRALVPGRGAALVGEAKVAEAVALTRDFLATMFGVAQSSAAKGMSLKETFGETRRVMDPKFSSYAIYEHCLPFNVSRAFDEARGIEHPRIWTDRRDKELWDSLHG